jgi:hypothetical protein
MPLFLKSSEGKKPSATTKQAQTLSSHSPAKLSDTNGHFSSKIPKPGRGLALSPGPPHASSEELPTQQKHFSPSQLPVPLAAAAAKKKAVVSVSECALAFTPNSAFIYSSHTRYYALLHLFYPRYIFALICLAHVQYAAELSAEARWKMFSALKKAMQAFTAQKQVCAQRPLVYDSVVSGVHSFI